MIVVDANGILASKDESHPEHAAVAAVIADSDEDLLLSQFVVAESDYMLAKRLGQAAAREFLDEVGSEAYETSTSTPATFGRQTGSSTATRTCTSASRMRPWW